MVAFFERKHCFVETSTTFGEAASVTWVEASISYFCGRFHRNLLSCKLNKVEFTIFSDPKSYSDPD